MALNIAVPLSGVGGISPASPIGLDCWENVKILASPIGSESSGVSSLDSDETKMQQCHLNHNNHHHLQQEPFQQQAFALHLQPTPQVNVTKNSNQNFANISNINLKNNINNALNVNVNNNNNQKNFIVVKKPQDLKLMYNGRDILDLGKNIETNTKLWNLKYTYLPENNNIPMFLANRSQYHRLGANGHIQEYTLYHCDHCDFQFPVMCNTANYMAQTSLNVTLTSNSPALYTSSLNNSGISVSNTNVTNSTSTITSINSHSGTSSTIDFNKQGKPNNTINNNNNNNQKAFSNIPKPVKKVKLTKEELNECDFSYTLKKVLIDYNNSINNGMQNFPIKCNNPNNNNNMSNNNQVPSIFSHSVAAVAAAAALSPQLSSQATSPSCCSSSGYSSNGSTHSLFSGNNNGIKYPVAAITPNCNNNNINVNVQNNFNKNSGMPFQQQPQQPQHQVKPNYNKSPTGINNTNNNSFYSLLNSLNNMNGNNTNNNNNNNNGNCNNNYGSNFWNNYNNNNNNNNNTNGLSYGANNNLSNQVNIHNPNLISNSANNQNFARAYKYF